MLTKPGRLPASAFSAFFRAGQVLETFRGRGIYQPAVDAAIEKLNQGQWVHLFGEGKVNQRHAFETDHGVTRLPRFKWGIGRILMETAMPPIIIPMWLTGFDKLMPEGRPFPWKFIPRFGCKLSITFGDPLSPQDIQAALRVLSLEDFHLDKVFGIDRAERMREGRTRESTSTSVEEESIKRDVDHVRSMVADIVQRGVETVGRQISGENLAKAKY